MNDAVIHVENLSKQYRLGQVGRKTINQDINRWWSKVRGKEDPYLKIGDVNDRTKKGSSEYVWALRDINFEVKQGEVLGIIGRNGAGKSTLLKILSKVTSPTTGEIKVKGRIASLLEVGTGFHPDLSGRDNVFLNGAILGMTKKEIQSKFDEIIDFAGIERYIDTPVKRYSSGMYVRLAFAVAAHLEPDILIVDEVLAVGDAEFQKKCLGKMKEVSVKDGRTVLFVSHNMTAVKSLCTRGILLKNGIKEFEGTQTNAIDHYIAKVDFKPTFVAHKNLSEAPGNEYAKVLSFKIEPVNGNHLSITSGVRVVLELYNFTEGKNIDVTFDLRNAEEVTVFHKGCVITSDKNSSKGIYIISFELPPFLLNTGMYYLSIIVGENLHIALYKGYDLVSFNIINDYGEGGFKKLPGVITPLLDFHVNYKNEQL